MTTRDPCGVAIPIIGPGRMRGRVSGTPGPWDGGIPAPRMCQNLGMSGHLVRDLRTTIVDASPSYEVIQTQSPWQALLRDDIEIEVVEGSICLLASAESRWLPQKLFAGGGGRWRVSHKTLIAQNMSSTSVISEAIQRAAQLDKDDVLAFTRSEFNIPTRAQIASTRLPDSSASTTSSADEDDKCIYLCGNSLGLQPKRTQTRIQQYLSTWATQGVQGHFKPLEDSPLPTWLDADDRAAQLIAPIVGASVSEVAVMQTLTANLHLLMSAFYKPDINGRHKIILESKAFPSDHFAVETQLRHHGLDPATSMITLTSPTSKDNILTTEEITSAISLHADSTALLVLPGIQYYTGQLLDMPTITAFARSKGIFVIWDLAHAVGNVPLSLHDWDVDAAAWCSYKYLNGGPGCIGGLFVHERNSAVPELEPESDGDYQNRLAGWWGNNKSTRFQMKNKFYPVKGAAGFQLSNPSILDITSLCSSLEVFASVPGGGGMQALREKSLRLTNFLEELLLSDDMLPEDLRKMFRIITPRDEKQRGAQLSLMLLGEEGLLEVVMKELEEGRGIIVDERRPNVIRVAPTPLYNSFGDVVRFVEGFAGALRVARAGGRK
ncbi:pyridoxal phosphate-dependent transferase [Cladorrhinum sp. PSN332]|nr:pyridoxal phosphate-dependent transferase [Cladorrhinum sp. PSN332]